MSKVQIRSPKRQSQDVGHNAKKVFINENN